jgi:superoxide dismutase, Cu-Zn family
MNFTWSNIMKLFACAKIVGNSEYPKLSGSANFYEDPSKGVWVEVEVTGLPDQQSSNHSNFYGLHIHEIGNCTPPFDKTGDHYNPTKKPHPNHAGDLPPLLGNDGYAFLFVYTNRLKAENIINRSIVIHSDEDDFTPQPSGAAGDKIGCGVIRRCMLV